MNPQARRRSYDLNIKKLIANLGNPYLFPELGTIQELLLKNGFESDRLSTPLRACHLYLLWTKGRN